MITGIVASGIAVSDTDPVQNGTNVIYLGTTLAQNTVVSGTTVPCRTVSNAQFSPANRADFNTTTDDVLNLNSAAILLYSYQEQYYVRCTGIHARFGGGPIKAFDTTKRELTFYDTASDSIIVKITLNPGDQLVLAPFPFYETAGSAKIYVQVSVP